MREVIVLPFAIDKRGTSISTNLSNCKGMHSFPDNTQTITARIVSVIYFRFLWITWSIVLIEPVWGIDMSGELIYFENPENSSRVVSQEERLSYLRSLGWKDYE